VAATIRLKIRVVAYEPCVRHAPMPCSCPDKKVVRLPNGQPAVHDNEVDLGTTVLLGIFSCNVIGTGQTVNDTTATGRALAANSAVSAASVVAGTGSTPAAVGDTNLQAQSASTSGVQAITSCVVSGSTITIVGTITNGSGSTIAYDEVGLIVTVGGHTFLLAHDAPLTGGPFNVSNGGTLQITYTGTIS
jgi:hypothetical protein